MSALFCYCSPARAVPLSLLSSLLGTSMLGLGSIFYVTHMQLQQTLLIKVNTLSFLSDSKGVDMEVEINMDEQLVTVTTTLSSDELLATIKKTGRETEFIGSH